MWIMHTPSSWRWLSSRSGSGFHEAVTGTLFLGSMSSAASHDHLPVKPGEYLGDGKYLVDAVLGVGGMGVVVQATHAHLKQKVAIKFMLPKALENEEAVQRFLLEARSAAALKSEHVARVLDVGTLESGAPYIVMEFLQGITLDHYLEQGNTLSIEEAVEYTVHACEAVAEAHSHKIAHRDIKLSNLFLTVANDKRPMVKVIDFGLSKTLGTDSKKLTRDFSLMGTPAYMSPEQLKAQGDVDERTDIWSLGVCLYELLTARVPFEAASVAEVCANVLNKPPVPPTTYRDIPDGLVAVIDRCLSKDPNSRYSTVAELAAALDPYLPANATGAAERIHRVQSEHVTAPRFASQPITDPLAIGRGTVSTWGGDGLGELVQPRHGMRGWIALFAVASLVAIGLIAFAVIKRAELRAAAAAPPEPPSAIPSVTASAPGSAQSAAPPALATAEPASVTSTPAVASPHPKPKGAANAPRSAPASGTSKTAPKPPASVNRDKLLENR